MAKVAFYVSGHSGWHRTAVIYPRYWAVGRGSKLPGGRNVVAPALASSLLADVAAIHAPPFGRGRVARCVRRPRLRRRRKSSYRITRWRQHGTSVVSARSVSVVSARCVTAIGSYSNVKLALFCFTYCRVKRPSSLFPFRFTRTIHGDHNGDRTFRED